MRRILNALTCNKSNTRIVLRSKLLHLLLPWYFCARIEVLRKKGRQKKANLHDECKMLSICFLTRFTMQPHAFSDLFWQYIYRRREKNIRHWWIVWSKFSNFWILKCIMRVNWLEGGCAETMISFIGMHIYYSGTARDHRQWFYGLANISFCTLHNLHFYSTVSHSLACWFPWDCMWKMLNWTWVFVQIPSHSGLFGPRASSSFRRLFRFFSCWRMAI